MKMEIMVKRYLSLVEVVDGVVAQYPAKKRTKKLRAKIQRAIVGVIKDFE